MTTETTQPQENAVQTTTVTPTVVTPPPVVAAPVATPATVPAPVAAPAVEVTAAEAAPVKVKKAKVAKAAKPAKEPKAAKPAKEPKAKKEAKAESKEEKSAPHTGQSGPEVEVAYDKLNANERKVLDCYDPKAEREPKALNDLAATSFPNKKKSQANSWVRNAMRRLVCGNWTEKTGRGMYRLTVKGRNRLQKLEA